jgi:MFS family permease
VISYGFQHVTPGASLAGWRIMFIVLGCVTVAVGLGTILLVPDTPMKARWLSDNEKVAVLKHVSVNMTGIQDRKFRPRQILEALLDPQLYLMVLAVILVSTVIQCYIEATDFYTALCFQWCCLYLLCDLDSQSRL